MVFAPDKIEVQQSGRDSITVKLSLAHLAFLTLLAFSTIISVVVTNERLGRRLDVIVLIQQLHEEKLHDHEQRLRSYHGFDEKHTP